MKDKVKKVYKMLPCPSYDIERIESWLEDMGKEGLLLEKKSFFSNHFLCFIPCRPQNIRYRLEPKEKGLDNNGEPPEEARALAGNYGWEFVCAFEMLYIYRTVRPDAPEMNTDNLVQAVSLKRLKKDLATSLFWHFILVTHMLFGFNREPFRFMVTFGSIYVVLFLLYFTGVLLVDAGRLRNILRLQKQLKQNIPMDHGKDWKHGNVFHRIMRLSALFVFVFTITITLSSCTRVMSTPKPSTLEYPGDPPFMTVSDLYPEHTFTDGGLSGIYNYYQQFSSDCCENMLNWREFLLIHDESGEYCGSATMIVQYYETAAPWLAQGLAQDFIRRDAQWRGIHSLERLPDPELGFDYVFTYNNILPTIVIRHGNTMVKATLSREADLYRWAEGMAQMLK